MLDLICYLSYNYEVTASYIIKRRFIMYFFLALLDGLLITLMIMLNGFLADAIGLYFSLAIVNLLSLFIVVIIIIGKKISIKPVFMLPKYFFLAGLLGLFNTTMNSVSFLHLGAALTTGLVLYGQLVASIIVDFAGLF